MIFAFLSDIHANLTALKAVLSHIDGNYGKRIKLILLGDFINYGPRPNEVIELLKKRDLAYVIIGNHENSFLSNEFSRFSSIRGVEALKYTSSILSKDAKTFILQYNTGFLNIEVGKHNILLVHGDLSDVFWGNMSPQESLKNIYTQYDYVFSGHTHIPNFTEIFFPVQNITLRNKKKTSFINPGSVGQPRNQNPNAQYCLVDFNLSRICFEKVPYDIEKEMTYYDENIDLYYKLRLKLGV